MTRPGRIVVLGPNGSVLRVPALSMVGQNLDDPALGDPAVIVVTLDPWRDTPSRLASIQRQWEMEPEARVASGSVDQVQAVLDAWGIERARDARNGDLVHVPRVFVLDRAGNLAYEADPDADLLVELASRL